MANFADIGHDPNIVPRLPGDIAEFHPEPIQPMDQWDLDNLRPPPKKIPKKLTTSDLERLETKKAEVIRKRTKEGYLKWVDTDSIIKKADSSPYDDVDFTAEQKARYTEIIDATPEDADFMTPEEYYLSLEPDREVVRKENLEKEPNNTKYWSKQDYLDFIKSQNEVVAQNVETEFSEETQTLIHTAVAWLFKYATQIFGETFNPTYYSYNITRFLSSTHNYDISISPEVFQVYLQKKPVLEDVTKTEKLIVDRENDIIENQFPELMEYTIIGGDPPKVEAEGLVSVEDEAEACSICKEYQKDHIIVPCGHICLCGSCQSDYSPNATEVVKQHCPICKGKIRGVFKTFA